VAARVQDLDDLRSDEPGPADDSDLHVPDLPGCVLSRDAEVTSALAKTGQPDEL
jgi:hypothetical protein